MNNLDKIIIHGTDVSWQKLRDQFSSVNQFHKLRDFPLSRLGFWVGYHRLITGGKNYKCKYDSEEGAHTIGQNFTSLGVSVGFDGDIEYPHPDDYVLLQKQVWAWQDMYQIPDSQVFFHRSFNTLKTCPGSLLGVEWMAELLRRTPRLKPEEQEEKQKEILRQKISLLEKIINLYLQIKSLLK